MTLKELIDLLMRYHPVTDYSVRIEKSSLIVVRTQDVDEIEVGNG